MTARNLFAAGVLLLLIAAVQAAEPLKGRTANTPEEALKLLQEYAKQGNAEGCLSMLAEPSHSLLQGQMASEKIVAVLEAALDAKLGKGDLKVHAVGFAPGKNAEPPLFVLMTGSLEDGLKQYEPLQDLSRVSRETRKDGTVVLSVKDKHQRVWKFTAVKDRMGWRLIDWAADPRGEFFEPDAKRVAACQKAMEEARAVILEVARRVGAGEFKTREQAWLAVATKFDPKPAPQPIGPPEKLPPPEKKE
jgi:hypothetical protein